MLPILRILPVGGVFLALLIFVLAQTPPGTRPLPLAAGTSVTARGPLLDRNDHPEWRQVLIQAALRRADELLRLQDLPDTPVQTAPPQIEVPAPAQIEMDVNIDPLREPERTSDVMHDTPKVVGLPTERVDADPDPDSITGAINETASATIPLEIGETSSTELPVVLPEERPPVIRTPERTKPPHESRRKRIRRPTHAGLQSKAELQPPPPLNFFEALFGGLQFQPLTARGAQLGPASMPMYRVESQ